MTRFAPLALSAALSLTLGCAGAASPPVASPSAPVNAEAALGSIAVTSQMGSPHPGDQAPDFELVDQHGATVKLSELRGSVVVLAFVTSADLRRSDEPGSPARLTVRLAIAPGYHVMSDRPCDPFSIPTTVGASGDGLAFGAAEFPAAKSVGSLSVFDGAPEVRLPVHPVAQRRAAHRSVTVDVRYQACTDTQCLPPVRKRIEVAAP